MNCFSGSIFLSCLLACASCGAPASETDSEPASSDYTVHYTITPHPADGSVDIAMQVNQAHGQLREMSFDFDQELLSNLVGDGSMIKGTSEISWRPDSRGGQLSWRIKPFNKRSSSGYDALLNDNWGIFRAEDIIPRARTRTLKGAIATTTMNFKLPIGWSAVTEYSSINTRIDVNNPQRRFSQPTGWIAIGDLGVRRETIAGVQIAIAAPKGEATRRMDMLALLNWTLPELTNILSTALPRLTIVSAGDPMWRGGLSAPGSIFIHADRPLISENATSTLLHEVVHVAFGVRADKGYDWIAEGLAEYYSLELLHRGGAITARRYHRALEDQADWSKDAASLCGSHSSGAATALAVVTFRKLDIEIQKSSNGAKSLDNVVDQLYGQDTKVSLGPLQQTVASILERPSETLHIDRLPGCKSLVSN